MRQRRKQSSLSVRMYQSEKKYYFQEVYCKVITAIKLASESLCLSTHIHIQNYILKTSFI